MKDWEQPLKEQPMTVIEKTRLPKGLAYALKASMLEAALERAGIDCHVEVRFWMPQEGGSVLEAHYWLPNEHVDHPRVHVRAGAVASTERAAAQAAVEEEILPAFIAWLTGVLALPAGSPLLHGEPAFNAVFAGGQAAVTRCFPG